MGEYDYIINVCGGLVESGSCNKSTGVGTCQTKPGAADFTPIIAGRFDNKHKIYF